MEVALRPATPEDTAGLARISVDSWRVAYRGLVPQDYLDALTYEEREQGWVGRLGQAGLEPWVLLVDGRIGGFVTLVEARPDDGGPAVGELEGIYLHPNLFGLGLGRRLMELALERLLARGHTEAVLWVLDGNRRAERFYRALLPGGRLAAGGLGPSPSPAGGTAPALSQVARTRLVPLLHGRPGCLEVEVDHRLAARVAP
jgi:ribosomal protein S18 acetylase RimI-like enzyme